MTQVDLDHLNIPEHITGVHHIADIMLIGPDEHEATSTDGLEQWLILVSM